MSSETNAGEFRLWNSVLGISMGIALSFSVTFQSANAADIAEPAQSEATTKSTPAGEPTSEATSSSTETTDQEAKLPNVDHLLGEDSSPPDAGLTGNAVINETAMVTPPKVAKPPATKLPPMSQVKLHYKNGKYFDALKIIATLKPTELTHYYAGLCYQGQGQLQKAASSFSYLASNAKDPLIRYNSNAALQSVSSYSRSRRYSGQGNTFARASSGGGGGGGSVRRG